MLQQSPLTAHTAAIGPHETIGEPHAPSLQLPLQQSEFAVHDWKNARQLEPQRSTPIESNVQIPPQHWSPNAHVEPSERHVVVVP